MSNTPHTLEEEFPDRIEAIHARKAKDAVFALLLKQYDEVNDAVHLAETRVTPMSEEAEEELRRKRLVIKDEIVRSLEQE
ncbi:MULTISPECIES: YdcH family protein [Haematobacter]|uniref:DUF465 domain-containing protein n=1 Tax=Haematobacter genomosp. 1 TaxID=366618 RepID=A0A212A6K2_9RHOB|nr:MULTISPECIES: DUF465 domain-containing protein [Haematobacter]OWJ74744.1 hypothetical protein CDV49_18945 [Haematobacter genomosp. 1]